MEGRIRIFTGIEVDILADGALDLDDEVLAQMDVVIASVHTRLEQGRDEMTARAFCARLKTPIPASSAIPPDGCCCGVSPIAIDTGAILRRAAELGVAVEHNAAPERLDLSDRDLRLAKEMGCKIVINTDAHNTRVVAEMKYGIRQLRRAWLAPGDVLNTLPPDQFLACPEATDLSEPVTVMQKRGIKRRICTGTDSVDCCSSLKAKIGGL